MNRWIRIAAPAAVFLLALWLLPWRLSAWGSSRWMAGDPERQSALAAAVGAEGEGNGVPGVSRFASEWRFATWQMSCLGFVQVGREHSELAEESRVRVQHCLERLLQPSSRAFDKAAWGDDALEALERDGEGHLGVLGYGGAALAAARLLDPHLPQAALEEKVVAALVRRMERSPALLIETYPGETFPPDNTTAIAAVALHDRATGSDHRELIARWTRRCREHWLDGKGLLYQCFHKGEEPLQRTGRGSGTMLAVYFLSFLDDPLSGELWQAGKRELADSVLGFGGMREYPRGVQGPADVDSGPVILGLGASASGFALAGARIYGDDAELAHLMATVDLFGAPLSSGGRYRFASGGPLGDAILLAMLTAPRRGR